MSRLTLEEKVAQLLIVAAVSSSETNTQFMEYAPYVMDEQSVSTYIRDYHVGGVIFLGQGVIEQQIELTRAFQQLSDTVPLFIAQDLEWGLTMRLSNGVAYPKASILGRLADEQLLYAFGSEVGKQALALGVHIVLGPVADIDSNPNNPVIGARSLGREPYAVARKAQLIADGLCEAGVFACAKHFPGHGDTIVDSHYDLLVITKTLQELAEMELIPFVHLINGGIPIVMLAHCALPSLTAGEPLPATLAHSVATGLLRQAFGFSGLIITDGLGMKALTDRYTVEQIAVMAFNAGCDLLLCPVDVPRTVRALCDAVHNGSIDEQELKERVIRILRRKKQMLMDHPESFTSYYCEAVFHSREAYVLQEQLNRQQ